MLAEMRRFHQEHYQHSPIERGSQRGGFKATCGHEAGNDCARDCAKTHTYRDANTRASATSKLCAGSRMAHAVTGGNDAPKYFAAMTTTVMTMASTYKTKPSDILIGFAPVAVQWNTRYNFHGCLRHFRNVMAEPSFRSSADRSSDRLAAGIGLRRTIVFCVHRLEWTRTRHIVRTINPARQCSAH
jgi:hypothetical protein